MVLNDPISFLDAILMGFTDEQKGFKKAGSSVRFKRSLHNLERRIYSAGITRFIWLADDNVIPNSH